jgi:membrane protease YdiL (CAAX protease family)
VLFLISPVTGWLAENAFAWMPAFLLPDGSSAYPPLAPGAVLAALVLGLVFDGVVNPVVEELYFRGYLLPRISRLGWAAPLLNAFLFTLQHYWQPYNFPLIFLIQLAIVYVVWWKRNIYISMLAHCSGNTIGALLSLIAFFGSN